jgi:hypothetical protein
VVALLNATNTDIVKLALVVMANLSDSDAAVRALASATETVRALQGNAKFAQLQVVLDKLVARLSASSPNKDE